MTPNIFDFLAGEFINLVESDNNVFTLSQNHLGSFGFKWMHDYTGLMARPARTGRSRGKIARSKQGLFDIIVHTGEMFP